MTYDFLEKHFYHLTSYFEFSWEVLRMYDAEKHSSVLENAPGFARLYTYIYGPVTKGWHWGMFIH